MKKQPKFEKGDVVLIKYKPISPTVQPMERLDFTLGIVEARIFGDYVILDGETNESFWCWPTECLTLISKGDFK